VKLAILGGSFNPIHAGHLYLADTALSALGYDRVLLIPACISPFKPGADMASAKDRLDMILASIPADPRIGVDDVELRRGGISFTIDTVNEIIERYRPRGKPGLIIGDDLTAGFHKWKSAAELAEKADLVIARRLAVPFGGFPFPHTCLYNEAMPLSSREIRARAASGGAWRSLVPQGARCIIEDRGLYGFSAARGYRISAALAAAVEEAARASLGPGRFLHSRNTALLASDIAVRCGLDPAAAYLAGVGHDLGKALDNKTILDLAGRFGPLDKADRKNPALLHGQAAAVLLRERFGVHNEDVLEAVALHTTGARRTASEETAPLTMVVFIADKIEFSRREINPAFREQALNGEAGLEELFLAVLEDNVRYLEKKGIAAAEETLKLRECLTRKRR
jgi:nicotinate-nucleotide adenylyltransferase